MTTTGPLLVTDLTALTAAALTTATGTLVAAAVLLGIGCAGPRAVDAASAGAYTSPYSPCAVGSVPYETLLLVNLMAYIAVRDAVSACVEALLLLLLLLLCCCCTGAATALGGVVIGAVAAVAALSSCLE